MKKSIAFFFLVVFCFSISGYSIELHYCKGEITDISFFGKTYCHCEAEMVQVNNSNGEAGCKKHCHHKENFEKIKFSGLEKKGCCKTEKLVLTNSKLKAVSSTNLKQVLVASAVLFPSYLKSIFKRGTVQVSFFTTPLIAKDITGLTQVYRI